MEEREKFFNKITKVHRFVLDKVESYMVVGRHLLDDIKFSLTNGFMKTGNTELTLEKSLIKVETWHFPRLVKLDKTAQSMGKYKRK